MGFIQKHLVFLLSFSKEELFQEKAGGMFQRLAESVLPIAQVFFERHNRCWINKQQNELYYQQLSSLMLQHDRLPCLKYQISALHE